MWGELNPALIAPHWNHDKNTVKITVNDLYPKPCHEQIKYYYRWMRELPSSVPVQVINNVKIQLMVSNYYKPYRLNRLIRKITRD